MDYAVVASLDLGLLKTIAKPTNKLLEVVLTDADGTVACKLTIEFVRVRAGF